MIYKFFFVLLFAFSGIKGCRNADALNNSETVKRIDDSINVYLSASRSNINNLFNDYSTILFNETGFSLRNTLDYIDNPAQGTYDYYRKYIYVLILNEQPYKALRLIRLSQPLIENQGKYYFDLGLIWAAIRPNNSRDSTIFYIDRAIESSPQNPDYYAASAIFYSLVKKPDMALKQINKAVDLSLKDNFRTSQDTSYVNLRGALKFSVNDFEGALKDLEFLSSKNMNEFDFYYWRAYAFLALKNFQNALENAEKSISLNANYIPAYIVRSSALYKLDRKEESYKDLRFASSRGDSTAIKILDIRFPGWREKSYKLPIE